MIEGSRLAALMASKVCHDLVGPMSAMIQGVEMLKEAGASADPDAVSLIEQGVAKAWAKLDYYRYAFGGAGPSGDEVKLESGRETAERLYSVLKPDLAWRAEELTLSAGAMRLFMNVLPIAADALPRGGIVTIETGAAPDAATETPPAEALKVEPPPPEDTASDTEPAKAPAAEIRLIATGLRAGLRPAVLAGLAGETPEDGFMAHNIQPALTALLARQANVALDVTQTEERVEMVLRSALFRI